MRFTTCLVVLTFLPLLIFSQDVINLPIEDTTNIKNFNVSIDFINTFDINLETSKRSDTITGIYQQHTFILIPLVRDTLSLNFLELNLR